LLELHGSHIASGMDARHAGLALLVGCIAGVVLIITVANIATMMLLRSLHKRHEIGVRLAREAPRHACYVTGSLTV
ncbi:MAG: hypothetical protein ACRELE_03520, partial [Gemmatimonadales bacterium]